MLILQYFYEHFYSLAEQKVKHELNLKNLSVIADSTTTLTKIWFHESELDDEEK